MIWWNDIYIPIGYHLGAFGSNSPLAEATACLTANGTETARQNGGSPTAEITIALQSFFFFSI